MVNLLLNWFSDRGFYVTIADADFGRLKSLHTLFDKYLDHMLVKFEQNRMVRTIKKKWLTIFDAILEYVSVTETIVCCWNINLKTIIFQCSKNYGTPTRIAGLYQTWQTRSVSTKTYRSLNRWMNYWRQRKLASSLSPAWQVMVIQYLWIISATHDANLKQNSEWHAIRV